MVIEFTPLTNLDSIIEAAESDEHFDILIISNEGVKTIYQMGLASPLDISQIPNYQDLHANLKFNKWAQFNAEIYAVPWAWGPTGLLYDTTKISEPDSWNILWNPEYRDSVSVWDDVSMIWITALSLGYKNVFNLTKQQLKDVKDKLHKLNEQVVFYYAGNDEMFNAIDKHNVGLLNSWFNPSKRLAEENKFYRMVIPKEGAVGMFDSYLISSKTDKKDLSHRFINHQISPKIQNQMIQITGLAPANIETISLLEPEEIKSLHLDKSDYFNKMILWDIMPRKHLYEELLTEIRDDFQKMQVNNKPELSLDSQ